MKKGLKVVAVSGGFDPLHVGHIRMFKKARALGGRLVVILNNDNWLRAKKGYVFMPEAERAELLRALPFVDEVYITKHPKNPSDMSVCDALGKVRPDMFGNGGDRRGTKDIPEAAVCKKLGIKMVFGVGGGKVQSSSWMVKGATRPVMRTVRPWGEYYGWDNGTGWNLKTIYIKAGKRLSLQYHRHRSECWLLVSGDATATVHTDAGAEKKAALKKGETFLVSKGEVHRLESKRGGVVVEVAYGAFDEDDITRLEDDHGRPLGEAPRKKRR